MMNEEKKRSTKAQREAIADACGLSVDPLSKYANALASTDVDPFELFVSDVLSKRSIAPATRSHFRSVFSQWEQHMSTMNRHPACPNEEHVTRFIEQEIEHRENAPVTVKEKLRKLVQVYEYWQMDPCFPHPEGYNPFTLARSKYSFEAPDQKKPPRIPVTELREFLSTVPMIRDRSIISLQLKLGLRATELCNITLGEISSDTPDIQRYYTQMGAHPLLRNRPNAVYIPHDRAGNKSGNPRVLPLDTEMQELLARWLRIRPDNGQPWLFLTQRGNQLRKKRINGLWKECFHPEYAESETRRPVTSHYGRHRFTTYWRVERGLERPLIKYMRGDRPDSRSVKDRDGIDEYIHTYYEDIEHTYRKHIYTLLGE